MGVGRALNDHRTAVYVERCWSVVPLANARVRGEHMKSSVGTSLGGGVNVSP